MGFRGPGFFMTQSSAVSSSVSSLLDSPRARQRLHLDLFLPDHVQAPFRDQRDLMERPFFSLSKDRRIKPIDYRSPDGKLWVHVSANLSYGMATIWDADILIYCASLISREIREGRTPDRVVHFRPYSLLRAIGRPQSSRSYELLCAALDRLQSTTVKTNIRAGHRHEATFSWIDRWEHILDDEGNSLGMMLELSSWFMAGVGMKGGVLSIDQAYFDITGGRERWLYKVARKHAGGTDDGFAIAMPTLFEKSGAEGNYRRFKFEMLKLVERNALPGFDLSIEHRPYPEGAKRDVRERSILLRMRRRSETVDLSAGSPPSTPTGTGVVIDLFGTSDADTAGSPDRAVVAEMIKRGTGAVRRRSCRGFVSAQTHELLSRRYGAIDIDALHTRFADWVHMEPGRIPENWQSAFIGFVDRTMRGRAR